MKTIFECFIEGDPAPGGSKTGFYSKKLNRVLMMDACKKNPAWKKLVATIVKAEYKGKPLEGAIVVYMKFFIRRPKSHYGTGKNADILKSTAPLHHTQKPDLTKFVRSTEDACTGILWVDDAQIDMQINRKYWANKNDSVGVLIEVKTV